MSDAPKLCLILLLCATPGLAQRPRPTPASASPDIVVTGRPLKEAQAELTRCIEQRCPPDQDVAVTLAVAETQFVAGDYRGARATMYKALGRDHRYASSYPVSVSNLLRAYSRVAAHLGEEETYFSSARGVVSALKAGLPDTDWRVLGAQVELGDAFARTKQLDTAIDMYRKVAQRARSLGLGRIEGFALLRIASSYAAASVIPKDDFHLDALKACDVVIANTDPGVVPFGHAAELLKARLLVQPGDPGAIDRLIAIYRTVAGAAKTPVLLYAPPIAQLDRSGDYYAGSNTMSQLSTDAFDGQWVDISFEIAPDGTVIDVAILRQTGKTSNDDWVKAVTAAITGRRYAPLEATSPASFRVERYTFTSAWIRAPTSRLRMRSPLPRIESLDLSREPATVGL